MTSQAITAILLDIEGTTTPIDFVYKVLFPYARSHVSEYLSANLVSREIRIDIEGLVAENEEDRRRGLDPPSIDRLSYQIELDRLVSYVHWLMDHDRKTTPLKSIQGKIWQLGYLRGELRGQVFEDVPRAFERWRSQDRQINIYSSGSLLAQKLLFSHTDAGDLTPFISNYFDTNIGGKKEAESYRRIAAAIQQSPDKIFFVSDTLEELQSAAETGFDVAMCVRPGNEAQTPPPRMNVINTFDEIPA